MLNEVKHPFKYTRKKDLIIIDATSLEVLQPISSASTQ